MRPELAAGHLRVQIASCVDDALVQGAASRADVLGDLMDRVPDWRLAVAVWSEEHSGGHCMWHGVDPGSPLRDAPTATLAA